jgi:hypothetical protein
MELFYCVSYFSRCLKVEETTANKIFEVCEVAESRMLPAQFKLYLLLNAYICTYETVVTLFYFLVPFSVRT